MCFNILKFYCLCILYSVAHRDDFNLKKRGNKYEENCGKFIGFVGSMYCSKLQDFLEYVQGCAVRSVSVCVTKFVLTGECVIVHHAAGGE